MWYLHGPDRTTPYEDTLRAVNELHKEGKFKRFGISNFMSCVPFPFLSGDACYGVHHGFRTDRWEVAEMVGICKTNGYIQPTAYQGIYNAIHRSVSLCLAPLGTCF